MEKGPIKIIAENRKARHDYLIVDQYEAGLVLTGGTAQLPGLRELARDSAEGEGR